MKYQEISLVLTEFNHFVLKHKIKTQINFFSVKELRNQSDKQDSNWAKFEKGAGTYCFFSSEEKKVVYIGMSMDNSGDRIYNWLFNENKVNNKVIDEDLILIFSFEKDEFYMAPALESYLISKINPFLNRKK